MFLALLYSVFRLLLDALIDRRRSDAGLRLGSSSSGTNSASLSATSSGHAGGLLLV